MQIKALISIEFDGEIVKFDVSDAMRFTNNVPSLCYIDLIDLEDLSAKERDFRLRDHKLKIIQESEIVSYHLDCG